LTCITCPPTRGRWVRVWSGVTEQSAEIRTGMSCLTAVATPTGTGPLNAPAPAPRRPPPPAACPAAAPSAPLRLLRQYQPAPVSTTRRTTTKGHHFRRLVVVVSMPSCDTLGARCRLAIGGA